MTETTEENKIKTEIESKKPVLAPEMCSWTSEDDLYTIIEIVLPGVEKDTIKLRMNEETVFVTGESDDVRYVGGYGLCCPVAAEKAHSTYKNGLLRVEVPFLEEKFHTVDVKID
ncbi:MAG: Hsp20/alpha crystallin family protein [Candidatus Lokiarchaeota archaeon]|nr:Hsp20/alpha crystallin family protein [Candidatus Lokiarchaeota archaeon]